MYEVGVRVMGMGGRRRGGGEGGGVGGGPGGVETEIREVVAKRSCSLTSFAHSESRSYRASTTSHSRRPYPVCLLSTMSLLRSRTYPDQEKQRAKVNVCVQVSR